MPSAKERGERRWENKCFSPPLLSPPGGNSLFSIPFLQKKIISKKVLVSALLFRALYV